MYNVQEMLTYQKTKEVRTPMLSDYTADFWTEYKNSFTDFDEYFKTLYKSFVFFDQEDDDTVENVSENFTATVENYLRANNKRLSELWRINVIADDDSYNLAENYYRVDSYTKSANGQSSSTSGQRTDINDLTVGSQNIKNGNNVTGFNSNTEKRRESNESTTGTRNDITQFTQGRQQNTASSQGTETYTMTSHGAIGTMSVTDLLGKQETYWKNTQLFYEFVFSEICEKFLLLGGC